ncbi:hypothetical protein ACF06W_11205 [Streptomyces albus]|uniref:hypothetical protein n=1 Tax=Streptomyces albus TaxID=1888 RepID=UPI0036FDB6BB
MKYVDAAMRTQRISERSVRRLEYIARKAPIGRFEIRNDIGELWDAHEVRTLQMRGLWDVEWLEPGDENHEGGWRIIRLDEVGKNVIRNWQQRREAQQ